jgi:hypothetical protein
MVEVRLHYCQRFKLDVVLQVHFFFFSFLLHFSNTLNNVYQSRGDLSYKTFTVEIMI